MPKLIKYCGECADYDLKKHRCKRGATLEDEDPRYPFYGDCPLPDVSDDTNRDWLCSLSAVELIDWIKNTAAGMSDAELLKWMEEKHEHR